VLRLLGEEEEEEEEEDLFVWNDNVDGPRTPAAKQGLNGCCILDNGPEMIMIKRPPSSSCTLTVEW
jgi:hypothetical protein